MSKDLPLWEPHSLERPCDVLNFLLWESIDRLVEPAYTGAIGDVEERLKAIVEPEAWQEYLVLANMSQERELDALDIACKLLPVLLRTLEPHKLACTESFETLLESAVSEAGLSPKTREEIVALHRVG